DRARTAGARLRDGLPDGIAMLFGESVDDGAAVRGDEAGDEDEVLDALRDAPRDLGDRGAAHRVADAHEGVDPGGGHVGDDARGEVVEADGEQLWWRGRVRGADPPHRLRREVDAERGPAPVRH